MSPAKPARNVASRRPRAVPAKAAKSSRKTARPAVRKQAKPAASSVAKRKAEKRTVRPDPTRVEAIFRRFRQSTPEPKGELEHSNPYTLLVAVV